MVDSLYSLLVCAHVLCSTIYDPERRVACRLSAILPIYGRVSYRHMTTVPLWSVFQSDSTEQLIRCSIAQSHQSSVVQSYTRCVIYTSSSKRGTRCCGLPARRVQSPREDDLELLIDPLLSHRPGLPFKYIARTQLSIFLVLALRQSSERKESPPWYHLPASNQTRSQSGDEWDRYR